MYIGRGWQTVDSAPAGMAAQEALAVVCCEVSTLSPICGAEVLYLVINAVSGGSLLPLASWWAIWVPGGCALAMALAGTMVSTLSLVRSVLAAESSKLLSAFRQV